MRDGIPDSGIAHCPDGSRDISDLSRVEAFAWFQPAWAHDAGFNHIILRTRCHHADGITCTDNARHNTEIYDDTPVAVIIAVKNQCAQRFTITAAGRRDLFDNCLHNSLNINALFCRDCRRIRCFDADDILDFLTYLVGTCRGKINFIDNGNDFKTVIDCQICVCECLCFNSLRSINYQNRTLASCK